LIAYRALAAALVIGWPAAALGFELETTSQGVPLAWKQREIDYDVLFHIGDPQGDLLSRSARASVDTWVIASKTRLHARYLGPARTSSGSDGRSTIEAVSSWDPRYGDPSTTIAFTQLFYDTTTGELREGDMFLNADHFVFAVGSLDALDPQSVITHEVGHLIGFAHSCGDAGKTYPSCFDVPDDPPGNRDRILNAVMAPTLSTGTIRRALGADDLAGMLAHYAPSSTISVPIVSSLDRDCPRADLVLRGQGFPADLQLEARYASGAVASLAIIEHASSAIRFDGAQLETGAGDVDLVVRDGTTRAYGALVAVSIPPACTSTSTGSDGGTVNRTMGKGGCRCSDGSGRRQSLPALLTLLIVPLLRTRRLRALVVALAVLAPGEALAYKCSRVGTNFGPSLMWTTRTIPWWASDPLVDSIPHDEALTQMKDAFLAWQNVPCTDIMLPFQGEMAGLKAEYNPMGPNQNVVVFDPMWPYDAGVIAVTTNTFDNTTGIIADTDIELNSANFHFVNADDGCIKATGSMDLRNALTHEAGHMLGLDHPPNTPEYADDTMFASAPPCETTKRTPKQDDMDGICSIYPKGLPNHQCFPPTDPSFKVVQQKDGFGCSAVRSNRGSTLYALVLLALIAIRLRRD
jgi:hypothetical protein